MKPANSPVRSSSCRCSWRCWPRPARPRGRATDPATAVSGPDTPQAALGSGFTYQGLLNKDGSPATGRCDFTFSLWNAASGGSQVGSSVTQTNIAVTAGTFTVELDFGDAPFLSGEARWLQVAVRCPTGSGSYTTLSPRQPLTATPFALYSRGVWNFGATGSMRVGTPLGNGPGWTITAANGHRRDIVGDNLGVYIGASSTSGAPNALLSVHENGNVGIGLDVPSNGKLQVYTTSGDAIRITKAGDDGIQIGEGTNFPNYAIWMPDPGSTYSAVTAKTAQASGEWGVYTPDKIRAANVALNSVTLVAFVAGAAELTSGDLVAAAGYTLSELDDAIPLVTVTLAGDQLDGIVGVVTSRMELMPEPGKDGEDGAGMVLYSVPGPAHAGDYVAITIAGVAQVKAEAAAGPIVAGQRLTRAATAGHARALQSRNLDGMIVAEGAPVIGVALEPLAAGQGLIWALVNPQ